MKLVRKKYSKGIIIVFLCLLAGSIFAGFKWLTNTEKVGRIQASTVVLDGDFRMTADNKWEDASKINYAELEWDEISNLTQTGYRLYQSVDQGLTWTNQSLNYGKSIKVLNVYPNREDSNTLKGWMDGLGLQSAEGVNLIQVTSVRQQDYNLDPDSYLKNSSDEYQYDVIMFGSWDSNNSTFLNQVGYEKTKEFINSGRGALFGHDTVLPTNIANSYFKDFVDYLGVGVPESIKVDTPNMSQVPSTAWTGSQEVQIINNGYLMKYPFELEDELVLNIPYSHSIGLSEKSVGTVWAEFINPSGNWANSIYDDGTWRGGWYLKTNNNVAMIQTGHSNGTSTEDEQKIIANVLYNLAQVSLESDSSDYAVRDDQAPDEPTLDIRCGDRNNLNIRVDAQDNGKIYQWYVEADTKDRGLLQSDTVQEEISSNIAGYFYRVSSTSSTADFKTEVEGKKDSFGRIAESEFDLYVAPNSNSLTYSTVSSFSINEKQDSNKYVQVIAVDRMSNVSEVKSVQVKDLVQNVDFEIERTGDEGKLVETALNDSLGQSMETLEIQVPKHVVIKDFASLVLPVNWISALDSTPVTHNSYIFTIKDNNDLSVIEDFLDILAFTINAPVNQSGTIKIIFHPDENQESLNDLCWNSEIPQKISLKAYDEDDNALTDSDLLYDQQLRIGQTITVSPPSMDFYEFLELRETDDTPRGMNYTVSNTYQEGKIIYSLRKAILHVRQVVLDASNEIVVPTESYVNIRNLLYTGDWTPPALDPNYQANLVANSGRLEDNPGFTDIVVRTNHLSNLGDMVELSVVVPEFYQYLGNHCTPEQIDPGGASHIGNDMYNPGEVWIAKGWINNEVEYWITLYLKPNEDAQGNTKTPQPYSWDYKKNDLGKIKTK